MKRNFLPKLGSFLTTLSCLFFCGTAYADPHQKIDVGNLSMPQELQTTTPTIKGHELKAAVHGDHRMRKAPSDNPGFTNVITEVEGTSRYMRKSCGGYFMFWGTSLMSYSDNLASEVVYGDNNEVYFPNILSKLATGYDSDFRSYVKGTVEGDKVVVTLPQTVMLIETYGEDSEDVADDALNLCVLNLTEVPGGSSQSTYECNYEKTSVCFEIGEDGSLMLEDIGEDSILGLAYASDGAWAGYGDLYQLYEPLNAQETTMPEGVESETYGYTGDYSAFTDYADFTGYFTNIAIDGDTLYIQGIFSERPDDVIAAKLDGDIAHVAQDQLVFIYADKYFMTTKILVGSVYVDEDGDEQYYYELADPEMTYDLRINWETREISSVNPDICLAANAYDDEVYYFEALKDFTLRYQDNADGVPMNPQMVEYVECREYTGFDTLCFAPCNLSTEGKVLVADDMYYRIYIDDELVELKLFEEDDVAYTEIPMFFNNYNDLFYIQGTKVEVGVYPEDVTNVGVQFVYLHDGVETESEIVTVYVKDPTGVKGIEMDAEHSEYYNLNGRRTLNPSNGIFVVRSFMKDGSCKISKMMAE